MKTDQTGAIWEPKLIDLSLRLLRSGTTVSTALKVDHGLTEVPTQTGTLFIGQTPAIPPTWAGFLTEIAPSVDAQLRNQNCSAILFIDGGPPSSSRLFAICFGQGHHSLDSDRIERRFGLRVVLNCVARGRLRTLDSASLDSTVIQRRVQASRETDLQAFGIDTGRDLLRLASGAPTSVSLAKAMSGRDALHVRARIVPNGLPGYCTAMLNLFRAKHYKTDFAFIDHIEPVENQSVLSTLDSRVFAELAGLTQGKPSDLHLAIPDILSPESNIDIGYFGAGFVPGPKQTYSEITIEDYVAELIKGDFSQVGDMASLRASHEIRVISNGEGDRGHKRKLYSCFVFELTLAGKTYVLFDGQWYLISDKYSQEIEAAYQSLLRPSFLPTTRCKNEKDLILELCQNSDMLCIDQTRSAPQGAANAALEACDFLTRSKQLIHLKDGHSSAPLSHLWNQALVSAEAFVRDGTFRNSFRAAVRKREQQYQRSGFRDLLPGPSQKPAASEYKVVFGVMRHKYAKTGNLGLPFFSKVALRAVASQISLMGFQVELHLIAKT